VSSDENARHYPPKWSPARLCGSNVNTITIQGSAFLMKIPAISRVLLLLSLVGCSTVSLTTGLVEKARGLYSQSKSLVGLGPNSLSQVDLITTSAPKDKAIVVEIAFAYSDAVGAILTGATEGQWFAESNGYCASYEADLDLLRLELPAGYNASVSQLPTGSLAAKQIVAFVAGVGKADLSSFTRVSVIVTSEELATEELPGPSLIPDPKPSSSTGVMKKC